LFYIFAKKEKTNGSGINVMLFTVDSSVNTWDQKNNSITFIALPNKLRMFIFVIFLFFKLETERLTVTYG